MKATGRDSISGRHFEHSVIEKALECCGDNSWSSRSAAGIGRFVIFHDECGGHAAERSFARGNDIGLTLNQSEGVWLAGIGRKIVQFIVQDDPILRDHEKAAECQIDRLCAGNCVTIRIHNGEMAGSSIGVEKETTVFFRGQSTRH